MSGFEELVRRHQAAVCATAYAVLRDRARSEEIAQDAFLVAWQRLPTITPPPPLPAWICGVARNLARNALRKRREAPMTDDDEAHTELHTPLDAALSREHADLANRALAALPAGDRELVVLYYRCDESIGDVAASLAIPEATARKRLSRTRARLRDALATVEAMLRTTRPGPAFTVACVAALAAGREVAAATMPAPSSPTSRGGPSTRKLVAGGGVVVVAAALVVVRVLAAPPTSRSNATASTSNPTTPSGSVPTSPTVAPPVPPAPTAPPDLPRSIRRISALDRAALLARRRGEAAARVFDFSDVAVDTAAPASDGTAIPTLSKRTLRAAIARLHPMLRSCGDGHGRLAIKLRLVGEDRGTVVESVAVLGDAPLSEDGDFVACVETTLASLELPPMEDTVPWDVYYPFVF